MKSLRPWDNDPLGKNDGHNDGIATTFPQYKETLRTGIQTWQSLNVDFYFKKFQYNPLGDLITACPHLDRPHPPPGIDGNKEIILNLPR